MKQIVILFPGIGYHCDKPLLYYGRKVAMECGYCDVRNISYSYDGAGNIRGDNEKINAVFKVLYEQAKEELKEINWAEYEDILFVSKSIGTMVACAYAKEYGIACRHVLYTPLELTYQYQPEHGIAFLGTKDPWSDVKQVIELSESLGMTIYIYEAANHSLEVVDCMENLRIIQEVMEKTKEFIHRSI